MVFDSAGEDDPARAALAELYRSYWYPLYAWLRHRNYPAHDAQDHLQSFFEHLLEKRGLAHADPLRGKFRAFLLTALRNFVASRHEHAAAKKRGGGAEHVFLDAQTAEERYRLEPVTSSSAEQAFDLNWAHALLDQTTQSLRADFVARGRGELFGTLAQFLTGEQETGDYEATAKRLGIPTNTVKTQVRRLRMEYRSTLRAEIARTVGSNAEIEEELAHLREILAGVGSG